jgi:hypothetical protein
MDTALVLTILAIISLIYSFFTFIYDKNIFNIFTEAITRIFEPTIDYLLEFLLIL